jgi:hypothetical protein
MIELDACEGMPIRFELQPVERVTKARRGVAAGGAIQAAPIEITTPLAMPLTAKLIGDNAELAAFWEAESGRFHYDYVSFRVTLMRLEGREFERVWIEVQLADAAGGEGPIAYSLSPLQAFEVTQMTSKVKVSAKLKLVSAESGSEERKEAKEHILRAWREHTATPYWELSRTDATSLLGTFRLHAIVRSPVGSRPTGRISVRAVIERKTFWIVRTDPAVPIGRAVEFTLGR